MPKLITKYRIRKMSFVPRGAHRPKDEEDEHLGARLYLTKGDKNIDEEFFLRGIQEETKMLDNKDEEFEINENLLELRKGFSESDNFITYGKGLVLEKSFEVIPYIQKGVKVFVGTNGKEDCKIQGYEFDKAHFDKKKAVNWLQEHTHSLTKGDIDLMDTKELLAEIDTKLDEKLKPIHELTKAQEEKIADQGKKIEEMQLKLEKSEKDKEDPPPSEEKDKTLELEKSFKDQTEATNTALEEIKNQGKEVHELLKELQTKVEVLESQPLVSGQPTASGFLGVNKQGGKVVTDDGKHELVKGADGEMRFRSIEGKGAN